jgi:hypothetical protein
VALADKAGMPDQILETYGNYIDDLTVRLQIGTTLGEEHKHRSSIHKDAPSQCHSLRCS